MKRLLFSLVPLPAIGAAFAAGTFLAARIPSWIAAEAAALGLVLAAAWILPGPSVLWTELLGTAATLPVLLRFLPPDLLLTAPAFVPQVLLLPFYWTTCLFIATLGPLFLLLLFGRVLK